MRKLLILAVLAIGLGAASLPALAHHGWSTYDAGTVLTIEAPILAAAYQNPHSAISLKDRAGKEWNVILAPPSRMERRGIAKDALVAGKTVTVVGYPSRTVDGEMRAERIILDGKTIELR
ncbi:DUF6152 family protein [Dongia sedimenti]|uniref:DUF6152 family protein n=1 Tax=Dongia sedimenti TaxID=3064282 RepID=A0ABU0YJY2_9PROT|nr:DUF6152 family protein [Rhodospirillaceae bacterium R-7]